MLVEIPRFHRQAAGGCWADTPGAATCDATLREFLAAGGFCAYFVRHFMEPLVAAVWSCDPDVALDYPARYLFTFLAAPRHARRLRLPQWRTVTGGSRGYVAAVAAGCSDVRTSAPRSPPCSRPPTASRSPTATATVDRLTTRVVVATHPGHALAMLAEPTAAQREVLGAMPYSANTALLHTDTSLLPTADRRPGLVELPPAGVDHRPGERHRHLRPDPPAAPRHRRRTTWSPWAGSDLVDPATVIDPMRLRAPALHARLGRRPARLPELDTDRVAFAGAYHGWGFHEDGARSGLAAAERLGLSLARAP